MSNEPEEFEQLRKLLRLKRYEVPPPRFFNEFSGRVLDAISAEASRSAAERFFAGSSWLAGFFRVLERNALVAGSFVTGVCALLVGGIVYSEYVDQTADAASPSQALAIRPTETAAFLPIATRGSSLDPVFSPSNALPDPSDSLFRRIGEPSLQKVSFEKMNWNVPQ